MSETSINLSLPYIQPSQAQKHVTHNEALQILDAIVQLVVLTADQTTPPTTVSDGDRYIVASGGSDAWAGHDGQIAIFANTGWSFVTPLSGWRAQVLSPMHELIYDTATGWSEATGNPVETTAQLGINTSADATNRLAVAAPATLLNHDGAGHQLKLNKAITADTASLLYQTDYSGRAEMGLAGDDAFAIKVSPDGSNWNTALTVDPASGIADFPNGATVADKTLLHNGNILGVVAESGGIPTGAVVERGSNANGDYVRFADGTQICSTIVTGIDVNLTAGAIYRCVHGQVPFPMPFASGSTVIGSGSSVNTINIWVNGRADSETSWTYTAFSHMSRTADIIALMAVGRWY